MHRELANTGDGLRAFEVIDNNGYVLCFGRPFDAPPFANMAKSVGHAPAGLVAVSEESLKGRGR